MNIKPTLKVLGKRIGQLIVVATFLLPVSALASADYSVSFNGSSQYGGRASAVSSATDDVTMAGWFYIPSSSMHGQLMGNGNFNTGNGYGFGVGANGDMNSDGNYLVGHIGGVAFTQSDGTIGTGWHYLAMSRTSSHWHFFIDGSETTNSGVPTTGPSTPSGAFYVAGTESGTRLTQVKVAYVRFWNEALSSSQVTAEMNSPTVVHSSNLVVNYGFQENTGTSIADSQGGSSLTLTGSPSWSSGPSIATGGGGGGGGSARQFFGVIIHDGSSVFLRPTGELPIGAVYFCGATSSTQENCNASYDWASYVAGRDMEITGQTVNGTWYINVFNSAGGRPYDSSKVVGYYSYTYDGGVFNTPIGSSTAQSGSRFISLFPSTSTVPYLTNTQLGSTGYLLTGDYDSGDFVRLSYLRNASSQAVTADPSLLYTSVDLPISADGYFAVSTTTSFSERGNYTLKVELRSSSLFAKILSFVNVGGIFKDPSVKFASSTQFTVGYPSAFDNVVASSTVAINDYIANATTTFNGCTISGFDPTKCINFLFIPQLSTASNLFKALHDKIFVYFPFGYVTRLISIFSLQTPVEPPAISYTFGSSSPVELQGQTYAIQPFDHLDTLASIRADDGSNKNIFDIVDPWLTLIVSLTVVFAVLRDLLGIDLMEGWGISSGSNRTAQDGDTFYIEGQSRPVTIHDYSGYSNKEWRSAKTNRLL